MVLVTPLIETEIVPVRCRVPPLGLTFMRKLPLPPGVRTSVMVSQLVLLLRTVHARDDVTVTTWLAELEGARHSLWLKNSCAGGIATADCVTEMRRTTVPARTVTVP